MGRMRENHASRNGIWGSEQSFDCAAKLKMRTLTNLYNERPAWLDLAHKKLAAAYGWPA